MTKSGKLCGKRRNFSSWAISSFVTMFSKVVCFWGVRNCLYQGKGWHKSSLDELTIYVGIQFMCRILVRESQTAHGKLNWQCYSEILMKTTFKSNLLINNGYNPFQYTDTFWHLCSKRLLKTLLQKQKLLIMSNFLLLPQCFQLHSIITQS